MHYKQTIPDNILEGVWDERTCVRRQGGFDIDKTNLPEGKLYLEKGAPLALAEGGKVKLIKTAKAFAQAAKAATSLQVHKGHALKVGDAVNGSAISAINTENANYDVLTVAALANAVAKDEVVADAEAAKCVGLNYATVKLDDFPSCTPTLQAYEIEEDTLPYPINDAIKTALTSRHAFKL